MITPQWIELGNGYLVLAYLSAYRELIMQNAPSDTAETYQAAYRLNKQIDRLGGDVYLMRRRGRIH